MRRGRIARAGNAARALRLLRILLPVCLVVAAAVAGQGLFRVVSTRATEPIAQNEPSLSLGSSPRVGSTGQAAAAAVPPKVLSSPKPPQPTATLRPAPAPLPRLTRPVVVFNASAVQGLATRTARMLHERGVTVVAVGNFTSPQKPSTSTVFYPPGESGQAQALASLTAAGAVAPAPQWLQSAGKLVLVVTDTTPTS